MNSLNWLVTSTTYGTWLPGDPRGFVGRVWETRPDDLQTDTLRREHDRHDTNYDQGLPGLHAASQANMKGEPVYLNADHAAIVLAQFRRPPRTGVGRFTPPR